MIYPTIRIEGAILSSEILDKIEQGDLGGQTSADFGFDSQIKVKDEIVKAWADAQDMWRIFKHRTEGLAESATGTSETRRYWMIPLLGLLGFNVEISRARNVNGQSYAISHQDVDLDAFPTHIMGCNDSLDKKRSDGGPRMSPHALVQEYINLTEHLYALVTNGLQLRLLRDSSRLIKLSFLEFDLERMMDEEHYTDFAIMYRLIHASRMPQKQDLGNESLIEKYHQDALDAGSRIREGLSDAVKVTIVNLSNEFLNHSANQSLRDTINDNPRSADQMYQALLRLIYRLLFLMVIEERNLIFEKDADKKKRDIYYNFYSLARLRSLCEKRFLQDDCHHDLWTALLQTFRLFENEQYGKPLGINPLAGDLFSYQAIDRLNECQLSNKVLLQSLKNLSIFTHKKTGQTLRANYAALNVEEFGSVYEGLLEYEPKVTQLYGKYQFQFVEGSARSSSGSHYTPDELVQPLIKHSLDYIIEDKLKEENPENALLSIKVGDVACGSGHILLNAARRIGTELAKVRTDEDQPSPQPLRKAICDVICTCIYGVDKNPLAVELCKVALWLEAHNPGEPLHFLDHHIKCGDAIVGLAHASELENGIADEAFKTLPGDDKDITKILRNTNKRERKDHEKKQIGMALSGEIKQNIRNLSSAFKQVSEMPEHTPQEVEAKQEAYRKLFNNRNVKRIQDVADIQIAQFFIPKTDAKLCITDAQYRDYLSGITPTGPAVGLALAIASEKKFFHYFLEFPDVFAQGGFDCILGNPPYLGGSKISTIFGNNYLNTLKSLYTPSGGQADLVAYFLRRIFDLINKNKFFSLITTNTVSQGDTRDYGLKQIFDSNTTINFVLNNLIWPGMAAVKVTLICVYKGIWQNEKILNRKRVNDISIYFNEETTLEPPNILDSNLNKCYLGTGVVGDGFILSKSEAQELIDINFKNNGIISPYLTGKDLNNNLNHLSSREIINFKNWSLEKSKQYQDCYDLIENRVKPFREKNNDKHRREFWWQFSRPTLDLYDAIKSNAKVLVHTRVTKIHGFCFVDNNQIYSDALVVFNYENFYSYSILQSSFHENWAWQYSSTLKSDRRYSLSDCFENYPFPFKITDTTREYVDQSGENYNNHRDHLMTLIKLGLTKTLNQFHNLQLEIVKDKFSVNDIENQFGNKTVILWKHLEKTEDTCSFNEAVEGIFKLRELHKQMDEAVLAAYGWHEDGPDGPAIDLAHDFYEVDYLPENDQVRYTISPEVRKEVLKRLLLLNHILHEEEEVAAGLVDESGKPIKKKTKAKKKKKVRDEDQGELGV